MRGICPESSGLKIQSLAKSSVARPPDWLGFLAALLKLLLPHQPIKLQWASLWRALRP
jgi:hypothetical protein